MVKRAIDISDQDMERLAAEAWREAADVALRAGVPVVGARDNRIVKTHPDGRSETICDVASAKATDSLPAAPRKKYATDQR